ncbi:NodT family efflux transporter outer membrane factor (OMF) lipoprotein [Roseimicrobium gellanilyticum]|uniref:NodT family efflux transporter outer membrane factor (OMF) lipoprotein n=1 Tax=Roseimicrobium gellanilyticum TaxID=748857 RepID=A0A366H7M9_9BACT|nr:efflux transporter outer membrane subunit [Roseimicrobium gellanilyticum]RBP38055.1 NodT family efflux transporter outer membrane factor (OMF) lipoprotein [Roseimicrobium gellanilyticum]
MQLKAVFTCALPCLVFTGCALKQPPVGGDILTEYARSQVPGSFSASHAKGRVAPDWIRSFNDPELTRIVEDAIIRNPDLKAAAERVEASRAAVRIAAAALYPRVGLKGLGERQGMELDGDLGRGIDPASLGSFGLDLTGGSSDTRSEDSSSQRWTYGLGIGATWEADVWGRIRARKAAAKSDSLAMEATYEYARQSLAAQVARAYFSAIEAAQQAANARETLKLYEDYLKLTDVRKNQGFSSDYELAQVKSRTAAARDTLYAAEAAHSKAIRAIEVVTSYYPAGKKRLRSSFPSSLRPVPTGMPMELLERRPDLIAAERHFAAAFHRVHEAKAARLPRLAVSAVGGAASADLDGVGVLDAVNWSLAAGVVQPIFFGGELKAAQDLRTAEQRAAAHDYTATALRAFEDVEDTLDSEYHLRRRQSALEDMVSSSGDSITFGRKQLDEGHSDMFTILRLVGENLAAKIELTKIRAARLRERVNLHLALGGGFSTTSK